MYDIINNSFLFTQWSTSINCVSKLLQNCHYQKMKLKYIFFENVNMICPHIWCAFSFVSLNLFRRPCTCNSTRTGTLQSPRLIKWTIFFGLCVESQEVHFVFCRGLSEHKVFSSVLVKKLGYHMWEGKLLENQLLVLVFEHNHACSPLHSSGNNRNQPGNGSYSDTRLFHNNPMSRQLSW